jgi:tetratricopeptide (TPR) repeat protein
MTLRISKLWLITAAVTVSGCLAFAITFYPRGWSDDEKFAVAAQRMKAYDTAAAGIDLATAEKKEAALTKFQEAETLDPGISTPHYLIGTLALTNGDPKTALAEFDQALKTDKFPEHIYNNRGVARLKSGDVKGAKEDFDKALSIRPEFVNARVNRGLLFLQQGDLKRSVADFDAILGDGAKPDRGIEPLIGRAIAKARLGDIAGAEQDLNVAVEWARAKDIRLNALLNRAALRDKKGDTAGAQADRAEYARLQEMPKDDKEFKRPLPGAEQQPTGRESQQ